MPDASKVTIYTVAERAGVSISTVSLVINAPHRVSEQTRARSSPPPAPSATARARRADARQAARGSPSPRRSAPTPRTSVASPGCSCGRARPRSS
ncbi:LacI family DNA-binding transcriptional regulator [Microbacterium sp. LBN7]|uniref:LacI family DNA-binding transcriptional regulator n=1 Tax=Microbacterium sp. LBN7 TaxID=3129773 RepID=UPI00388FEA0E